MRKSIGAIFNRGANSLIVLSIVKLPSERPGTINRLFRKIGDDIMKTEKEREVSGQLNGGPRTMKMGTILSPWLYDAVAHHAL